MAEPKTKATTASVRAYLDAIEDPEVRKDAKALDRIMARATGARPVLWGTSIVGYGNRPVTYANGKRLDWPVAGFSPRKAAFSLYLMGKSTRRAGLLKKLGKHKTGGSCVYIKRLADVDLEVLEALVADAAE